MQTAQNKKVSEEEYLELERKADIKSEYYNGEMFAMAGASLQHNQIVSNLIQLIGAKLKNSPCKVFPSDLRLNIKKSGLFTYPDLSIVCGKPILLDNKFDTLTNPTVLIEVLSPSTQDYDKGSKFTFYREIDSLKEYILVDSIKYKVEKFKKLEQGDWLFTETKEDEELKIESIDCTLSLKDIYEGVEREEVG
ncbi:MAG: Uma2 family endonuclease [Leptospiraceae bacterium]|nr:Uma2 family endonuclease [Leptospiraceae bacterium]